MLANVQQIIFNNKPVVGRVGQFSSNTTNILLENSCLHIFKIRQFLSFKTLYLYSRQIGVVHE